MAHCQSNYLLIGRAKRVHFRSQWRIPEAIRDPKNFELASYVIYRFVGPTEGSKRIFVHFGNRPPEGGTSVSD